jgi:hypothetical protein
MADSSTEEKSHMLDLDDDALMKVFTYLDHYSQLDAMLVCRRFEALIGQNAQFFKNHRLSIKRSQTAIRERQQNPDGSPAPKSRKLMYFGRYFGDVKLIDYIFKPESIFFQPLLDTFEIIGSKINKLEIMNSRGYKYSVLEVLQLADNVKELIIERMEIIQTPRKLIGKPDIKKCTFPELRYLELSGVHDFAQIKEAFEAVDSLHHLKMGIIGMNGWNNFQQILFKQEDLRSLTIYHVDIGSFQMKNWNLEKLVLKWVKFPQQEVFQTFVNFIKSLNNVAELEIEVNSDERQNGNNYDEILMHLLNLPSLTKLKWEAPKNALNIRNPSVTSFASVQQVNYSEISRYFPNIETLEFVNERPWIRLDSNFESLVNLRELRFHGWGPESLTTINCPQLQKISIEYNIFFGSTADWRALFERHPNIEYVEYNADPHNFRYGSHFVETLNDFTTLKTLKCYEVMKNSKYRRNLSLVNLIGEKMTGLEHLEIVVPESNAEEVSKNLRLKFPQLGCDSRKFKKTDGRWDWLITLRKF